MSAPTLGHRADEMRRRAEAEAHLAAVRQPIEARGTAPTIMGVQIEDPDEIDEALDHGIESAGAIMPTTPARKQCNGCREVKALGEFGSNPASPDGKYTRCLACERSKDAKRAGSLERTTRTRATNRALYRLRDLHRPEFEQLLADEWRKATDEAQRLAAAAKDTDPHRATPRLMPGPRPAEQTVADRIREDVGTCELCIDRHDEGHICPACGAMP